MSLRCTSKCITVILAIASGFTVFGQDLAFNAAAIRLDTDDGPNIILRPSLSKGHFTAAKVTIGQLVEAAFDVTPAQVDGPGWLETNRFDIAANAPPGVPDSKMDLLLQALLRDRFKLVTHSENREMPVYELVAAKGGIKAPRSPASREANAAYGPSHPMLRGTMTMQQLARLMSLMGIGRPVLDKTGIEGRYEILLEFAPFGVDALAESRAPDLFGALKEELGLELVTGRDKLETIVIDHVERMPTEN